MISESRLTKIVEYAELHGDQAAIVEYDILPATLTRYKLLVRENSTPEYPNILLFDIETAPALALTWGAYKQYINHEQIIRPWFCLSWAGKWLGSGDVISMSVTSKEAKEGTDESIIKPIWNLLDEADIVIAHNGDKFDIPKLNTRFILHGLNAPSPYETIDTLKVARKYFRFDSNKLDFLGMLVREQGKIDTNFKLWSRCIDGEQAALDEMLRYNEEDVRLLEDIYIFLRPWIKSHPNLATYIPKQIIMCTNCGSQELHPELNSYHTTAGKFRVYRCSKCGALVRTKYNIAQSLSRSIAR